MTREIERKFIIDDVTPELVAGNPAHIRQGYLAVSEAGEVRIRDAAGTYTLTAKSGVGLVRGENEISLSSEQFETLWPATGGRRLVKRRYVLVDGGRHYEIDIYDGALAGLAVVEVEFPSETEAQAFEPPGWFGPEVTGDPAYRNASLATEKPVARGA